MNQSEFTLWLHGYVEICGVRPDDRQWEIIKDHLALVFTKVTPDRSDVTYCRSSNALPMGTGVPIRNTSDNLPTEFTNNTDGIVWLNPDGTVPIAQIRTC